MDYFLFSLKQQVSLLSLLFFLGLLAAFGIYRNKRKLSRVSFVLFFVLFFIASTAYVPRLLVGQIENRYPVFRPDSFKSVYPTTLIHVLGSGYNVDARLPPSAKLALSSLGRLTEGIRIQRLIPGSRLMCSGNGLMVGNLTQAEITRSAALQIGADTVNTLMLKTPSTTAEEARDLSKTTGTRINLILVTDALHMPRAMHFFSAYGFDPIPAPTNFRVPRGGREPMFQWMPKLENLELSDLILHEYLGYLKNFLMPSS
jgi:uncharacterized SAM-binding protein YcdF (DUF218 family)